MFLVNFMAEYGSAVAVGQEACPELGSLVLGGEKSSSVGEDGDAEDKSDGQSDLAGIGARWKLLRP